MKTDGWTKFTNAVEDGATLVMHPALLERLRQAATPEQRRFLLGVRTSAHLAEDQVLAIFVRQESLAIEIKDD